MPKHRKRKQFHRVNRSERYKPQAMTMAKRRPWHMQTLLKLGPDEGGLSAEQFESAIQIAEAFHAITVASDFAAMDLDKLLALRLAGYRDWSMSPREERLAEIWMHWHERIEVHGAELVEWIEGRRGGPPMALVASSLDRWADTARDVDDARRAKKTGCIPIQPVDRVPGMGLLTLARGRGATGSQQCQPDRLPISPILPLPTYAPRPAPSMHASVPRMPAGHQPRPAAMMPTGAAFVRRFSR